MPVQIAPFDPAEAPDPLVRAVYEMVVDAFKQDFPDRPVPGFAVYAEQLRKPVSMLGPRCLWIARDGEGAEVVGMAAAVFREYENSHLCLVNIRVAPQRRRAGVGTAMFRAILPEVEASGRELVVTEGLKVGGDGEQWAAAHGFGRVSEILMQRLLITDAAAAGWTESIPAGFHAEFWLESVPEQSVSGYVAALAAMGDGERTAGTREPRWSVERLHAFEREARERGSELRFAAAVRDDDGTIVAATIIDVLKNQSEYCYQQGTVVLPELRGRGLAVGLKAAALRRLVEERPAMREVQTHTSTDNQAMIHVNHRLGFVDDEVIARFEGLTAELRRRLDG